MLLVEEVHFRSLSNFFLFLFDRVHDLLCNEGTLEFNSSNHVSFIFVIMLWTAHWETLRSSHGLVKTQQGTLERKPAQIPA